MYDILKSCELLSEMLEEVKKLESTLGGGQKLGIGGSALSSLYETKICLGNPNDQLTRLTPKRFKAAGFNMNEFQKRQLSNHHFYYMTIAVNLYGAPGIQFDDLICELDFSPKGDDEPIIQALFPTGEWHDVLAYGGALSLGLNADLKWKVGLDLADEKLNELALKLPGSISADIENKNKYKAWIAVPKFSFSIGRKEIAAAGTKDSNCRWTISKPELHKEDTVEFGVVFKVAKDVKTIDLIGKVVAQPYLPWLSVELRHIFNALSSKFQKVIKGQTKIVVGDHEKWTLSLLE